MISLFRSLFLGPLTTFLFVLNTVVASVLLLPFIFLKILIPSIPFRKRMTRIMVSIGETWISANTWGIRTLLRPRLIVNLPEGLHYDRSYLISANHQSWIDITALQLIFNHRIPFLRFFLKKELIYVPLLGMAWWALDFPFMKRHSKSYLEKHPEARGEDLETTRKACKRFAGSPISIMNFLEGTRFTKAKHAEQKSPYKNLLRPKIGGLAFVIEAMGDQFEALLDVTIIYPDGPQSLWGLLSGKVGTIILEVHKIEIPKILLRKNSFGNAEHREAMQKWILDFWAKKDDLITQAIKKN